MPRGTKADFFGTIRAQAAKVLQQLEGQIRSLESELTELRGQLHQWRQLAGSGARAVGVRGPGRRAAGRPSGGKRVKWDEVLAFLPKRFGVEDVMKHPGAAAKGRAQVYPALNRWETTKRVRRIGKGSYEKLGGDAASGAAGAKRGPAKKRGRRAAKRGKAAKVEAAKAS